MQSFALDKPNPMEFVAAELKQDFAAECFKDAAMGRRLTGIFRWFPTFGWLATLVPLLSIPTWMNLEGLQVNWLDVLVISWFSHIFPWFLVLCHDFPMAFPMFSQGKRPRATFSSGAERSLGAHGLAVSGATRKRRPIRESETGESRVFRNQRVY